MPIFETKINNERAKNFVQQYIDKWAYINYQPVESLDDTQISNMADSLETFLQTEIGTPNNYTITVKLTDVISTTTVDDLEVVVRFISNIGFEITVVNT